MDGMDLPPSNHGVQTGIIITSALASLITGYMLGLFASRGYIISPALSEERRRYRNDPVESDESDIDEHDTPLDHAPNWANGPDADRRQGLRAPSENNNNGAPKKPHNESLRPPTVTAAAAAASSPANKNEECKLVLVVRTDLGMTKGKIAAQCSHATLACYKRLVAAGNGGGGGGGGGTLARWERTGQAKIAVQVKSQEELLELRAKARALGITAEVIQDAGRTQIEAGSMTVLGVGPAPKSLVDQITGHLKLL